MILRLGARERAQGEVTCRAARVPTAGGSSEPRACEQAHPDGDAISGQARVLQRVQRGLLREVRRR